jgi:hypothetical protein
MMLSNVSPRNFDASLSGLNCDKQVTLGNGNDQTIEKTICKLHILTKYKRMAKLLDNVKFYLISSMQDRINTSFKNSKAFSTDRQQTDAMNAP